MKSLIFRKSSRRSAVWTTILVVTILALTSAQAFGQVTAGQTFTEFKLNGLGSVLIPDSMELQAGAYKKLSDGASKELGYDVSGEVIFQQKGLNDFNFKQNKTYARVMFATERGSRGSYPKLTAKIRLTARELKALDDATKEGLIESIKGIGIKIVRWDGVSVVSVNGQSAIKTAYLRQLNDNPSVYVEMYTFNNNDRMHRLTISYRLEDANIWKDALEKAKNSFKIIAVS